ncbi:hypothetical protein CDL15_Pgr007733 [Punica granatum]|uniref:Uncharacterized protein n=1 Tax=Punica granatum TaxID=22663 RepID=A0A218X902_PUNGR|nr:hypothetical protein CDL15_Pgr007733 [Punica granatum]
MESTMILTCNRRRKREVKDDQRSVPDDEEPERQPRKWKRDVEISLELGLRCAILGPTLVGPRLARSYPNWKICQTPLFMDRSLWSRLESSSY